MAPQRDVLKFSSASRTRKNLLFLLQVFDFTRQSIEVIEYADPHFFEPPDNSQRKSFPSPQSNTVILVTPDFSKYPIFRSNFRFLRKFQKSGFDYNFEMKIRSLDIRNVNVFVFTGV